jgi:hypothetical protein
MSELKVGDRFYFPEQGDDNYKMYWGKNGVITRDNGQWWSFRLDDGVVNEVFKWRLVKEKKMFKVGQKVKVIKAEVWKSRISQVAEVIEVGKVDYKVKFSDGTTHRFEDYKLEEVKEGMTKDDLKTGMLVQSKSSEWYLVQKGIEDGYESKDRLINLSNYFGYLDLNNYTDDLKGFNDIMKVATVVYIGDIFRNIKNIKEIEKTCGFKVIWEREQESTKEKQLKKIIDDLQEQLKEKLEELKGIRGE